MDKLIIITDDPQQAQTHNSMVYKVLYEVIGATEENVIFSIATERLLGLEKIGEVQKEEFSEQLRIEIEEHNPKCILALGERPASLLGGNKNIHKTRGNIQTVKTDWDYAGHFISSFTDKEVTNSPRLLNIWAKDFLKAWNISQDIASSISPTKMVYCDTKELIRTAVQYVKQTGLAVFDFETPKIDEDKGTFKEGHHATMLSFSFQAGSGYVIPLEHKDSPFTSEYVREKIMPYLKREIFENFEVRKVAHNLNYDAHICRIYDTKLKGRLDDTMLMHHLYDETKRHGLKGIIEELYPEYAGYDDDLKGFKWSDIPIKILAQYNATDTDLTYRLMVALESWLLEDIPVYRIYRNLTMAAFRPLFDAETRGMLIDPQFLSEAIRDVKILLQRAKTRLKDHKVVKRYTDFKAQEVINSTLDELETKRSELRKKEVVSRDNKVIVFMAALVSARSVGTTRKKSLKPYMDDKEYDLEDVKIELIKKFTNVSVREKGYTEKIQQLKSGELLAYEGFNFGSWQQLEDLLYYSPNGFKFPTITGGTGKDIIKDLNDKSGFVDGLLNYRSLGKTLSTYLEGIYKRLDGDNRIHTSFKLHGTVSGRLSSANPNLQNVPNVAKLKDETLIHAVGLIKKSFVVPEGYTMFQYDYGQAELRTIASFAKETTMLEVYNNNLDLHAKTASEMMQVTLEEFYKLPKGEQKAGRSNAKAVNFGLIYGMSARGFMEYAKNSYGLILTLDEATKIRDTFFKTYPKLLTYHDTYIAKGKKYGWVRTLYGRRRRLPKIDDHDEYIASMDERAAINSPIQGTSGEFMVFAIALLHHRLDSRVKFVNTVHDSIIFYIPDNMIDYATKTVINTMENLPNKQYFNRELSNVGMTVDAEASKESWKDLKEIEL